MVAITSISPGHKNFDSQLNAVKSWVKAGYKVVSLNSKEEIATLKQFKDVEFVETNRTNQRLFKKPYVVISAIIDYLKSRSEDHFLIINSDIIINDVMQFTTNLKDISETGIIIMNRHDFNDHMEDGIRYDRGFDGFFINKKWLEIFPQSVLCLGQCFWDFWVPYQAVLAGVPIYRLNELYLFHKRHTIQYSNENWLATGEIFRGELAPIDKQITKFKDVPRMSAHVYNTIKANWK